MIRKSLLLLSVTSLALAIGCATPYPILKLTPEKGDYFVQGREYSIRKSGQKEVRLAFERNDRYRMIFNLQVLNYSLDTLRIDPKSFQISGTSNLYNKERPITFNAIDPETIITDIEKQISRNDADQRNQTTTALVDAVASFGQTIEESEAVRTTNNLDELNLKRELNDLNKNKDLLNQTMIRITDLPGESFLSGQIYFPLDKQMNGPENTILIPLGKDTVEFKFTRRTIDSGY